MLQKKKEYIFRIIQIGNKDDFISRAFDIFISAVIFINIIVMTLQTFSELSSAFPFLHAVEIATIIIFCIEYLLRIWTADCLYPDCSYGKAIFKFLTSFNGIIDILTILPFFFLSGFVVFRMLRVVRIFHLFRINAQYDSFNVIKTVLSEKKNQILSSVFILLVLMLAASIGIYAAEHDAQPEAYKNAFSGIWWSVSALLTVGYGDIYPITIMGKIMAILTAFIGVGVVAIPTGIISAGFVEQYTKAKNYHSVASKDELCFITIPISASHNWNGIRVKDTVLPDGLSIAIILRGEDVIIPRDDKSILAGDRIILATEDYDDQEELHFHEEIIDKSHPFAGKAVRSLNLSRLTTIVSIQRGNKNIVPNGSTIIQENDRLILYSVES